MATNTPARFLREWIGGHSKIVHATDPLYSALIFRVSPFNLTDKRRKIQFLRFDENEGQVASFNHLSAGIRERRLK